MMTVEAETMPEIMRAVEEAARAARGTVPGLASVPDERIDDALRFMADHLGRRAAEVLEANSRDVQAARADGVRDALLDRLRLDGARLEGIAGQLRALAGVPAEPSRRTIRELPGGLLLEECRRPVGVIGANFEARPNVVVDIASQFVKSRNAGVLRTGSAAIRSAITLADEVIAPALGQAGLDPAMIQLVRAPGQDSARALVSQPGLIPLVILRGSGDSTRALAAEAARHGVRTMAHADGGAVLYLDEAADLGPVRAADRGQPGPARRVQPAEPAARPPGSLGVAGAADRRVAGPAGHRGVAAPACPPAWPRVGAGRRARGDGDDRARRRPARGRRHRQRGNLRAGRGDRHRGPGGRGRVPRPPTPGPARSGTPPPACSTGSSCCPCPRPGSTSTPCPAPAARSPSATCTCASSWSPRPDLIGRLQRLK